MILALGTRIGFNATFYTHDNINRDAKIIHVELEPTAIGRHFPVEIGIWADAPTAALQLVAALSLLKNRQLVDAWTTAFKAERSAFLARRDVDAVTDTALIQPSGLFKTLRDVLPHDGAITMDAGTLCLQATDAMNYWQAKSLFTPLDFGLVGFSFACGLGVKLAQPERPVISLMGDGGFGMTVSELSTAVDHGINTVTIVMNNTCWGAEKAYLRDFFNGRYIGADISSPPFDKLAELYRAAGFRADTLAGVAEAALACGYDQVVDLVELDESVAYAQLATAIEAGKPWVGFCYKPHHLFTVHPEMTFLTEPAHDAAAWKIVTPEADPEWKTASNVAMAWAPVYIHPAFFNGLNETAPQVASMMRAMDLSSDDLGAFSYAVIVDGKDPAVVASEWIAANPDRVTAWLK